MNPKRPTLLVLPNRELRTYDWCALIRKWRSMGILAR
jgi:hypothetical protein